MKTVYLDWSDNEGVSFLLRTTGLWPFEAEEISAVFVAAGYADVGNAHEHFVSIEQPHPDGPQVVTVALKSIGYQAEHRGELEHDTGKLVTVHQILTAYSDGKITEAQVIEMLHLDEHDDLTEIMRDSEVPLPRQHTVPTPDEKDQG